MTAPTATPRKYRADFLTQAAYDAYLAREESLPRDALDQAMGPNDAGARTIRDYLTTLLLTLWREEQAFSGKRPFGTSGWKNEVYRALINGGLVAGFLDVDGYIEEIDAPAADALIAAAISTLANG